MKLQGLSLWLVLVVIMIVQCAYSEQVGVALDGQLYSADSSSSCLSVNAKNDDFCDCKDGSDEPNTSACSYLNVKFTCSTSLGGNVTIPASRVNDGICDCCDGSDELSSPFGPCANTCEESLQVLRKEALAQYREIQIGARARSAVVQKWKTQRDNERKSYTRLIEDRKELINYLLHMRLYLNFEINKESSLRLALIRERENNCGLGHESMCNLFHSAYFNDQELEDYGFQARYLAEMNEGKKKADNSAATGKRFVYTYSQEEIMHANSLHGMKKVHAAQCTNADILPDDDMRIFTTVGDYMNFMNSPGGLTHRNNVNKRRRQQENIFNRYLENGERGYIELCVTSCEWLGVLLSPVLVPVMLLDHWFEAVRQAAWQWIAQFNAQYRREAASDSLTRALGVVSQWVVDWEDEHSALYQNFVRYLDPRRYSVIAYFLDQIQPYLSTPQWMVTVILRAPQLYFEYYFTQKANELPPRRQACLLRRGISIAEEEIKKLEKQIKDYEEVQQLLRAPGTSGEEAWSGPSTNALMRDYGAMGEWQAIADQCISTTVRGYNYSVCFFQSITQQPQDGGTSFTLGRFEHWGAHPDDLSQHRLLEHYLVKNMETQQSEPNKVAVDQNEADDWGVRDLWRTLRTLPRHLWFHLYSLLQPSAQDVQLVRQLVDKLQVAAFGVRPSSASTRVGGGRPRVKGAQGGSNSIFADWNATITETLDQWQRFVIDYNHTFHLLHAPPSAASSHQLDAEMHDYYSSQTYGHGTGCFHVQPDLYRSVLVRFVCGAEHAIVSVDESSVCRYDMLVSTPLACSAYLENQAMDRLDRLGVFGFSKSKK